MDDGECYGRTEATDMDKSRMYDADPDEGKLNEIHSRVESKGHFTCNTTSESDRIAKDLSSRGAGNYQTVIKGGFAQVERLPEVFVEKDIEGHVIHEVDYGVPAGERFTGEMEIRDAIMGQKSDLYSGIRHTHQYRPDEVMLDEKTLDFRRVDAFITSNRYRDGVLMDDSYDGHNRAVTERIDAGSPWFNFENLRRMYPEEDVNTLKETYVRYALGHDRIREIESENSFRIDVQEHEGDQHELMQNATLFAQDEIYQAIKTARDINGSTDKPPELHFIDPERKGGNDILKDMVEDSWGAHLKEEGGDIDAILVNNNAPKESFTDGGLYHEIFHKKIREDHADDFDRLYNDYDIKRDVTLEPLMEGFEEVASNVKTYEFVSDPGKFTERVSEKYRLGDFSRDDMEQFMSQTDANLKSKASEVIAFFEIADRDRAEAFRDFLKETRPQMYKDIEDIAERYVRAVSSQEGLDFKWVEDLLDTVRNKVKKDVERDRGRFDP
mgnify:FL=1